MRELIRVLTLAILWVFVASTVFAGFAQTPARKPAAPAASPKGATQSSSTVPKPAAQEAEEEQIPPPAPGALFPAVVARVNGKALLGRDLEQRIQVQLAPIGNPKWENLREDYRQQLIDESLVELIGSELIYQKAKASNFKATEAEVQAEFKSFSKTFASDAEMNLALSNRGLDRTGLMRELERNLTMRKYVDETIAKKIVVTPAEVSEYHQKNPEEFQHPDLVRTSHILITVPDGATAEQDHLARQRAESILARLKKGEDFAKLAKEYSTDITASQGGDVGLTPKGQLAPEYEDAAFALSVGGVVREPVRTRFGYHIIKVTEKKKAGAFTLAEVQQRLTELLKAQKTDVELAKLVDRLRSQAKIEAYIPVGASRAPARSTTSSPRP